MIINNLKKILVGLFCLGALKSSAQAKLQIIHNAADPSADSVDIYVNGNLALDNFAFRTATPFLTLPAGVALNIGVAGGNSTSVNDTIKSFQVTLANGGSYVAIANGNLTPSNFASNPDGLSTAFTLFLQDQMRESALTAGNVDLRVVHGSSDAPTVDVIARNVGTLVNDAPYGAITPYISVPAASYTLDVTPAAGSPIVASFTAILNSLGGNSAIIIASGYLNPITNQNGPGFGLLAVLPNGTAFLLGNVTSIVENSKSAGFTLAPNPAKEFVCIKSDVRNTNSNFEISNVQGKIVKSGILNSSLQNIYLNDLNHGLYFVKIQNENGQSISKLIVE